MTKDNSSIIKELVNDAVQNNKYIHETTDHFFQQKQNVLNWILTITIAGFVFYNEKTIELNGNCLCNLQFIECAHKIVFPLILAMVFLYKYLQAKYYKVLIPLIKQLNLYALDLKYNHEKLENNSRFKSLGELGKNFKYYEFLSLFNKIGFFDYNQPDSDNFLIKNYRIELLKKVLNVVYYIIWCLFTLYFLGMVFLLFLNL